MDKIIRWTLGVLLVILIVFVSVFSYQLFIERAYRSSLSSTYFYSCVITTSAPLANVTLFIPVPADPSGNSPVVAGFSAGEIGGVPSSWDVTLYDTGKATLVKMTTPLITPPTGTGPYRVNMTAALKSGRVIDTQDPVNNSALFRPVEKLVQVPCPQGPVYGGNPVCHQYVTSLYADYQTVPDASVTISETLTGRNSWNIFGPESNEYQTSVSLQMSGPHQGWVTMSGTLADHIGTYDIP